MNWNYHPGIKLSPDKYIRRMVKQGKEHNMKKGRIRITHDLIAKALQFPIDWVIEEIIPSQLGESEMLISGYDFPETNNRGDAEDVELICHKENITYEVKKR